MVFTQKRFQTWTDNDAARMMRSLRDAEGIQGLDTRKPVLFGFSAGGQMALALWYSRTAMFGGLVLDAAYPLVPGGENGAFRELPLPRNKAIRDVPILVLVGAKDNGRKVWERLQPAWEKGGVPLTLHVVPEMGHAWLMGRVQVALLETWLAGLGKPEAPREAPPPGQRGH
jgi:predicted esterase